MVQDSAQQVETHRTNSLESERTATENPQVSTLDANVQEDSTAHHGWRFWFTVSLMGLMGFVAAFDNTIIFTALPTIVREVGGESQYVWIANSYVLASCAVQPLTGQVCNLFGRKKPFYASVCIFCVGAAIAGAATGPAMLIAGRTIQGLGCGGLFVLVDLIMCDITSQRERGKYLGIVMVAIGIGTSAGPLFGGALVRASWRWVFFIVLPFCGLALVTFPLLNLNYKRAENWNQIISSFDWIGNSLFMASIVSLSIGLVFGSNLYPWTSWHVLVPLCLGVTGWIAFHAFEASPYCRQPTLPPRLTSNRTAVLGYVLTWIFGMLVEWTVYMLPVYFQAVKHDSPLRSAINILPFNLLAMPIGVLGGWIMSKTGRYIPLHAAGFGVCAVGMGLMTLLDSSSSTAKWVVWQCLVSAGLGLLYGLILSSILASLPPSEVASATSLCVFMRTFGMVFGVTIPSVIFNSRINAELAKIGNAAVRALLGDGKAYGTASEGLLLSLGPQDRLVADEIYTRALRAVWYGAMGFSLVAFVLVFGQKHYDLATEANKDFDIARVDETSKSEKV